MDGKARAATRIHALVRSLGIEKARVEGHDIGLMVGHFAARIEREKCRFRRGSKRQLTGLDPSQCIFVFFAPNSFSDILNHTTE